MRRLALLIPLVAAACTVGPDYKRPVLPVQTGYSEANAPRPGARATDLARWWTGYGDPELDRLVDAALRDSLDVQAAISRVRQARYGVTAARAALFPTLDGSAQGTHSEVNDKIKLHRDAVEPLIDNIFGGAGGAGITVPGTINPPNSGSDSYNAAIDASWQLDIFGGVRRGVEAARAQVEAAEWDLRDAQVTLVSEVASSYMQLRQAQAQEAVARAEIARQTRQLQIRGHISQVGLVAQGDYVRQRAQLASAEATLAPLQAEQRIQVHALGVLLARQPADLVAELLPARADPPPPPVPDTGLPSDLLRRRPDVRSAERRLAAVNAEIGVATADLYPRFSLTGAAELMSMAIGNFATITGRTLSAGGAVSLPIFDGGRRRATIGVREAQRDQALIAYRQAVLGAIRDVEDALAQVGSEQRRNEALRRGVADSERAVETTASRWITGLASQNDVLDAQAAVLQQRQQLAQSDGMLRTDIVRLYRALGGGWNEQDRSTAAAARR